MFLVAAVLVICYPRLTQRARATEETVPATELQSESELQTQIETEIKTEIQTETHTQVQTEPESTEAEIRAKHLVVIDPGHQLCGDFGTEPLGPGSQEQKMRVSGGTQGVVTNLPEHELNLAVSLLLRQILTERGYEVAMTREIAEVSISNAERAQMANALGADVFLRIHANGDSNESTDGAMTLCMTPNNPYNADLYEESRLLSDLILDGLCEATGARKRSVWETDTMTGINWSEVPVTIVEMGFMTNAAEDRLLSDPNYQLKIAQGIADGLDRYFAALSEQSEAQESPGEET